MGKRNHKKRVKKEPNEINQSIQLDDSQVEQEPQRKRIKTLIAFESNQTIDACFYEEEEINQKFICPACAHRFIDPRLLPCGDTICQKCLELIREINSADELRFKCPVCQDVSLNLDKETLPKIKILQNLVELKPKEIYRNKHVEALKSKLNEIQSSIITIQSNLNEPVLAQTKHFDSVRNEIDLAAEKAKQAIDDKRDKLLKHLDKIGKESLHLQNSLTDQQETEQVLENAYEFLQEKSNYLKKVKLEDSVIQQSIQLSEEHLDKLDEQCEKTEFLATANKIKFLAADVKLDDSFLGIFVKKHVTPLPNYQSFSSITIDSDENVLAFEFLITNQLLVFIYHHDEFFFKLYNANGSLEKKVSFIDDKIGFCGIKYSEISSNEKNILLYAWYGNYSVTYIQLFLFDLDLNKICYINIDNFVERLTLSESKCYCIMHVNVGKLFVYDMNLKNIGIYGSASKKDPFFFNFAISQISVKDEKIYLLKNDNEGEIRVMDENSGLVLYILPFEAECFTFLTSDILIFTNKKKDKLIFSYMNGKLLKQINTPNSFNHGKSFKFSGLSFIAKKYNSFTIYS